MSAGVGIFIRFAYSILRVPFPNFKKFIHIFNSMIMIYDLMNTTILIEMTNINQWRVSMVYLLVACLPYN